MKEILDSPAKRNTTAWLFIFAWLLLVFIVWLVFIARNNTPDEKVFNTVTPYITQGRTNFIKAISFMANHRFLVPANLLLVAFLISQKNKWGAITAGVVALSSMGMLFLLKILISRHRPADPLVGGITNFSFPSGHAFMSVAFYGLLGLWTATSIKTKWQQQIVIFFLLLLVLGIGFSRVYLRVHYTTDVIAGFCIGTIWLTSCFWLIDKIRQRQQE